MKSKAADIAGGSSGDVPSSGPGGQRLYHQEGGTNSKQYNADSIQFYGERPESPARPSSSVPFNRDNDFVDREELTSEIQTRLARPGARVALVGFGGVGKSQLAIEHSYRFQEQLPEAWVLWFHASNASRFEQSVREVVEQLRIRGRQDAKVETLYSLLEARLRDQSKGKWLIILDNVDDAKVLLAPPGVVDGMTGKRRIDYLPSSSHGRILVTSRNLLDAKEIVEHSDVINVSPMEVENAVLLLEKKLGKQADNAKLAEALEYMPLAMTQAAAFLARRGRRCSVDKYLEMLRKSDMSGNSILDDAHKDLRRDREARNSIFLTWQISFEHILRARQSAADLLAVMSFCDRQAIPEMLLRADQQAEQGTTGEDESTTRNGLRSHSDGDGIEELREAIEKESHKDQYDEDEDDENGDEDHDAFDNDIDILEAYSFVSVTLEHGSTLEQERDSMFEMHRLVQRATQSWLRSRGQFEKQKEQFVRHLWTAFPPVRYENWGICQVLFPHAKAATGLKPNERDTELKWAGLMFRAGWYALESGNLGDGQDMSTRSMEVRTRRLGADDLETLWSISSVARAKEEAGDWEDTEELGEKIVDLRSRNLGDDHQQTIMAMANLGITYSKQAKLDQAEEIQTKVVEAMKRNLGEEHSNTLNSMSNLSVTLSKQEKHKEAEEIETKVVEAKKRILGEEHPETLRSMSNLGVTLERREKYQEAEEIQTKVVEAKKRILGEKHPDTLMSMSNLGVTLRKQEKYKEAEDIQTKVVEAGKRILGEEYPDTLISMRNLSTTYGFQGRLEEAKSLLERAFSGALRVFGPQHPDTVGMISDLEYLRREIGRTIHN